MRACKECRGKVEPGETVCDTCREWLDANPVPPHGQPERTHAQPVKNRHYSTAVRWWEDRGR